MTSQVKFIFSAALVWAAFCIGAHAQTVPFEAEIHIVGEVHDNPKHHEQQAEYLAGLKPKAVVFEMLDPAEADSLSDVARDPDKMRAAVSGFHWSNIADYAQVLSASDGAIIGAALPRDTVRRAFQEGAATVFGVDAERYGLNAELPAAEKTQRETLQFQAHCEAMPMQMMPGMVEAQRLRDAHFARVLLDALDTYGAPIVMITGNGHARLDWGIPAALRLARPDVTIVSIGQSEGGHIPEGGFDIVWDAPTVADRPDPCAAFR